MSAAEDLHRVPMLEAALRYAARGWHVLPNHEPLRGGGCTCGRQDCGSIGKHPRTPSGVKDATTDEAQIRAWWRARPNANVGINAGASGLLMIDVDGDEGRASLALLEDELGPLPTAPTVSTGRGEHRYFVHPGCKVRNTAKKIAPSIDIRSDNGNCIMPPSRHYSGAIYAWVDGSAELEPPELPPAWVERLREQPKPIVDTVPRDLPPSSLEIADRARKYLATIPPAVSGQGGHRQTFVAALHLVKGFGMSEPDALHLLRAEYNPHCQPPWSERELAHKVQSAASSNADHGYLLRSNRDVDVRAIIDACEEPREQGGERDHEGGHEEPWPDPLPIGRDAAPPPFPLHVLPPWIASFVEAEAASVQAPLDMPAMFALGALAAVTGGRVRVCAWDGFVEATNLYTVVAMPPSSIKSPVHKHVTAPIVALQDAMQAAAMPGIAKAQRHRAVAEKRLKRCEDAAAKLFGEEGELAMADVEAAQEALDALAVPPLPRILVDDSTPEQLKSLLAAHGGRLAMLSAESALFGNVASQRYSRTPNLEAVLAGHVGDRVEVDRRDRHEVIRDPRLTICIAVQPSVLRDAFRNEAARERGLFARFLYSVPPSNVGERDFSGIPATVPHHVRAAWDLGIRRIGEAFLDLEEPEVLPLSSEARAAFQAYRACVEPQRKTTGSLACIGTWAGKMDGHVLRLAGLLHVADEHARGPVTVDAVRGAIELMEYFTAHAMTAFDVMGEDDTSADARRVLAWVKTRGEPSFTRSDATVAFKGRLTADQLAPVLEHLTGLGYLRQRTVKPEGRGRPAEHFDVHPSALRRTSLG